MMKPVLPGQTLPSSYSSGSLKPSSPPVFSEKAAKTDSIMFSGKTAADKVTKQSPANPQNTKVLSKAARTIKSPHTAFPVTHVLGNDQNFSVMVTATGAGFSKLGDVNVTRWRDDLTRESHGTFIYLRDKVTGQFWSAGMQPGGKTPERYEAKFQEDRAIISRHDHGIRSRMEVFASPEDAAEVRLLTLNNDSKQPRTIEVTSYLEPTLIKHIDDAFHPAFQNLFLQNEFVAKDQALLVSRRPRGANDKNYSAAHVVAVENNQVAPIQYETDRLGFIGRGGDIHRPKAMQENQVLSGTVGVDPSSSLRTEVTIPPRGQMCIAFSTIAADNKATVASLAGKYKDLKTIGELSVKASEKATQHLEKLQLQPEEAATFQTLANRLFYQLPAATSSKSATVFNRHGLSALGLNPSIPMVVMRLPKLKNLQMLQQLLKAQAFWQSRGMNTTLVLLNEAKQTPVIQQQLEALQQANVKLLCPNQLTPDQSQSLQALSLLVLDGSQSLNKQTQQIAKHFTRQITKQTSSPLTLRQTTKITSNNIPLKPLDIPELTFQNQYGGFSKDGSEYVIVQKGNETTPAPWVNVIVNEKRSGFLATEAGSGFSWAHNVGLNKLSPKSEDPIQDAVGEAFYIRNDKTGKLWSPTSLPIRDENATYITRHGQGYSRFETNANQVKSDLLQFQSPGDAVKISRLKLTNDSQEKQKLTLSNYVAWALGRDRAEEVPFIQTEYDAETGALFAYNPANGDFPAHIAFLDLSGKQTDWTMDRSEFLGRNGSTDNPAALSQKKLGHKQGKSVADPCGVLQTKINLNPGESKEIVALMGQAATREEARQLIRKYRAGNKIEQQQLLETSLNTAKTGWDKILGKVKVKTPDESMNLMLNRWLLYQALAGRIWGRTGFYQSGGGTGFRDQLQDVMALSVSRPDIARAHILNVAARQFKEGDVQHWWIPNGLGARTTCSDDLVWLPYVVNQYITVTGDTAILNEQIPFLEGEAIPDGHAEHAFTPTVSKETGSLFEHCVRALNRSLKTGAHDLPLMGVCDWNDGMNRVAHEGKGESVWMGWFLHDVLNNFIPVARKQNRPDLVQQWTAHNQKLKQSLDKAWDGEWFRRAYFDDGTPLGSKQNDECKIDALSNAWSVISNAAKPEKAKQAMASVEKHLIDWDNKVSRLLYPAFDKTKLDVGYIKGYLPGIRENGQYTHAALWNVLAFARLRDGDKAHRLFSMLNPVNHSATKKDADTYKVEPYWVVADVYSEPPHVGRGGWTVYTGSAGWMYRVGVENILGLQVRDGDKLLINPCIPKHWPGYEMEYQHGNATYKITVKNPKNISFGVFTTKLDGKHQLGYVPLVDDGKTHHVEVELGEWDYQS